MSVRAKVVLILVGALVATSLGTLTVLTRVSAPPSCRIPNHRTLAPLSPGVVHDLRWRPEARLDLEDLRTPTVAQARLPSRFGSGVNRAMWACGWKDADHTAVIYRSREPLSRCFGIGCGGAPQVRVWVTCYTIYDRRLDTQVRPRGCLGYPNSSD